jgi:ribosomal protein L13E
MSTSAKKKGKPGKKAPARKTKAKVTKTKKVAKPVAAVKPKKAAPKVKKAPAEKKEAQPKAVVKVERVELGPPPDASVSVRHLGSDSLFERAARGFSFGELASAGVPLNAAKREGLSIDLRRRSVSEGNVERLKVWFKHQKRPSAGDGEKAQVIVATASKKK